MLTNLVMNWDLLLKNLILKEFKKKIIIGLAIKAKDKRISGNPFRLLMTGIRLFIKDKDTAIFNNRQLFKKYNMVFNITCSHMGNLTN